jgi:hypothetical protein
MDTSKSPSVVAAKEDVDDEEETVETMWPLLSVP